MHAESKVAAEDRFRPPTVIRFLAIVRRLENNHVLAVWAEFVVEADSHNFGHKFMMGRRGARRVRWAQSLAQQ